MHRPHHQLRGVLTRAPDVGAATERHATATASCGVCGRASIDELGARAAVVPHDAPELPVPWSLLVRLPDQVRDQQRVFAATGGLHATAITRPDGEVVVLREDVGRHNALDAAIGACVQAGSVPLHHHLGVLSGRIGFELVAKAAMAGLPLVAAVGAPTDLAVRTAERFGITLVGFLRGGTGNVYSHPHRVDQDA
jgi:FdhD protein